MSFAATVVALAVAWTALTGTFSVLNLAIGAAIATLVLLLIRDQFRPGKGKGRAVRVISLGLVLLREVLVSAASVALWTVRPGVRTGLAPVIVALPLKVTSDIEITLLANMITLTPGTLTVDVSADRKYLYVHALDCSDPEALKRSITDGFERRIIEALR